MRLPPGFPAHTKPGSLIRDRGGANGMARGRNGRNPLVPKCKPALARMKYEIAAELGLTGVLAAAGNAADAEFSAELGEAMAAGRSTGRPYLGHITTREAGLMGGNITRRLIAQSENGFV